MKYIIHPGYIHSKNDGDLHWITYGNLIRLYNVNPRDCRIATEILLRDIKESEDITHLYPDYQGNYDLP